MAVMGACQLKQFHRTVGLSLGLAINLTGELNVINIFLVIAVMIESCRVNFMLGLICFHDRFARLI